MGVQYHATRRMTIRCGNVPFRGNVASSAKVPSSAKGAFHDSLGFQPQVTIAPHSPALKARPMIQRCTPMFPTPVISSQIAPSWNAPLALPVVGNHVSLGLKPQAVM